MTKTWIDTTEVSKMVRNDLKAAFPDVKFSVKSHRYAGGSSIDVSWIDGPTQKMVNEIVGHYHGADFDGMQDIKVYNGTEYGNDFICIQREHSDAALLAACEWAKCYYGDLGKFEYIPARTQGRWTISAQLSTADYRTQERIYQHMHETAL